MNLLTVTDFGGHPLVPKLELGNQTNAPDSMRRISR